MASNTVKVLSYSLAPRTIQVPTAKLDAQNRALFAEFTLAPGRDVRNANGPQRHPGESHVDAMLWDMAKKHDRVGKQIQRLIDEKQIRVG